MSQTKAKRTIYNSVFTDLFSDVEYQLKLYRDLHPEDVDVTADDITDVTLKPVFTDQIYNDLGFRVGKRAICLVEAQTKWSENISLRTMIYLADTFRNYVLDTKQSYYDSARVELPKPELYVIYTGPHEHNEEALSLADTYWNGDDSFIDVRVKVIRKDNPNEILTQYAIFCEIYRKNSAEYGETTIAVEKTIDECIEKGILKDYLDEKRSEVLDMISTLFDDDAIREMHENSIKAKSREEGRVSRGYDAVDRVVADGKYNVHEACELIGVDYDAYIAYSGSAAEQHS